MIFDVHGISRIQECVGDLASARNIDRQVHIHIHTETGTETGTGGQGQEQVDTPEHADERRVGDDAVAEGCDCGHAEGGDGLATVAADDAHEGRDEQQRADVQVPLPSHHHMPRVTCSTCACVQNINKV